LRSVRLWCKFYELQTMPKHPGLRKRGNVFWIGRAVPKDLRGKGPFVTKSGKPKGEISYTLDTSDRKEAIRRVHEEWVKLDEQFEEERFKLRNPGLSRSNRAAKRAREREARLRRVSVAEVNPEREAISYFQSLEIHSERTISDLLVSLSKEELEEEIEEREFELGSWQDVPLRHYDNDGASEMAEYFGRRGKRIDPDDPDLQKVANLFRRARMENLHRDIFRLRGELPRATDALFDSRNGGETAPDSVAGASPGEPDWTLGNLVEQQLTEMERAHRSPKTIDTYRASFLLLVDYFGIEKPVREIQRKEMSDFLCELEKTPTRRKSRYPGKSWRESIALADEVGDESRLGARTLENHRARFCGLFSQAKRLGWIQVNPADDKMFAVRFQSEPTTKEQFTIEHLNQMFSAPLYAGCQNDQMGYNQPGSNRPRRGRFWVPLIGLFQGMRLNECCQLWTTDVLKVDGIPVFRVSLGKTEEEIAEKRLKTSASRRVVPIHPELIQLGFLDFVNSRTEAGPPGRLFPELKSNKYGLLSDYFSKWFTRFVRGTTDGASGATFHSFRHMFKDAIREADVSEDRCCALGGRSPGSAVHHSYGQGFKPGTLLEELEKVRYDGLNLSHLCEE